jgi:hypothetical protein
LDCNLPDYDCKKLSMEFTCPNNLKLAWAHGPSLNFLVNYKEETIIGNS